MKRFYLKILETLQNKTPFFSSFDKEVDYSVKKYRNTYKLLEKYDKGLGNDANLLADPEGLRERLRAI